MPHARSVRRLTLVAVAATLTLGLGIAVADSVSERTSQPPANRSADPLLPPPAIRMDSSIDGTGVGALQLNPVVEDRPIELDSTAAPRPLSLQAGGAAVTQDAPPDTSGGRANAAPETPAGASAIGVDAGGPEPRPTPLEQHPSNSDSRAGAMPLAVGESVIADDAPLKFTGSADILGLPELAWVSLGVVAFLVRSGCSGRSGPRLNPSVRIETSSQRSRRSLSSNVDLRRVLNDHLPVRLAGVKECMQCCKHFLVPRILRAWNI